MKDALGLSLSGANAAALQHYQHALDDFSCFVGDPAAAAELAIASAPDMPMAQLLKAWLHLLGTDAGGLPVARQACAAAAALPMDERESLHLEAASLLCRGHWARAGRTLEDLSLRYPRDLLALQAGHQIDYFTGDARMLRDRIVRAQPAWQAGMPGYHAVLSMHAFGLEENGDYPGAERHGRAALEFQPRDGWAWHAVAHTLEMRNDAVAGTQWLGANTAAWSEGSFFAVHNWWHLALFHLELDQDSEVLRLYDEAIENGSSVTLDLVDASALLWRLLLRGIDAGQRWNVLADRWQATGVPGLYAFNDLHMMMAYVGASRQDAQQEVLQAQRDVLGHEADNARFTREVGLPACAAVHAFGRGQFNDCVDLLRDIRSQAHRFGGSHAQRDVLDLTLLCAAQRAGHHVLGQALMAERDARRPRTAAARHLPLAA